MNEQDKAAFHAAWEKALQENDLLVDRDDFEAGWDAALAHRDSQPTVRLTDEELKQAFAAGKKSYEEWESRSPGRGLLDTEHILKRRELYNAIMEAHEAKNRGRG